MCVRASASDGFPPGFTGLSGCPWLVVNQGGRDSRSPARVPAALVVSVLAVPATKGCLWSLSHRHPGSSTHVADGRCGGQYCSFLGPRVEKQLCVLHRVPGAPSRAEPSCPQCHLLPTACPSLPPCPVPIGASWGHVSNKPGAFTFLSPVGLWGDTNEDITVS